VNQIRQTNIHCYKLVVEPGLVALLHNQGVTTDCFIGL